MEILEFFQLLFSKLGIKYTDRWLSDCIDENPYRNSMFGIGVILTRYGVSNRCVRLEDRRDIGFLQPPFIVIADSRFAIVDKVTDSEVTVSFTSSYAVTLDRREFEKRWDGSVILLSKSPNATEPDYPEHAAFIRKRRMKAILAALCLLSLTALGIFGNPLGTEWYWWTLLFLQLAGIAISCLLLQKQLHLPNAFSDRLCGMVRNSRCEDVTESAGGNVFGMIKLSEAVGGYFLVNTIVLLFIPRLTGWLGVVSFCSLPVTLWSIWYQGFRLRSWCVLCLMTTAVIWLQSAVYAIVWRHAGFHIDAVGLLASGALYTLAMLSANRLTDLLESEKSARMWRISLGLMKNRREVVEAFEKSSTVFDTDEKTCSSITFGNKDARRRVTVYSNPYCAPCAEMHRLIKDLPGDDLAVTYVFGWFSPDMSRVNRKLIACYQQLGPERTWSLLSEWYDGGREKGEEFFADLPIDDTREEVAEEFKRHERWKSDVRLKGTPTVIFNGREIEMPYTVMDYPYLPL